MLRTPTSPKSEIHVTDSITTKPIFYSSDPPSRPLHRPSVSYSPCFQCMFDLLASAKYPFFLLQGPPTPSPPHGRSVPLLWTTKQFLSFFLKKIFIFLERGGGREKERKRNVDVREMWIGCLLYTPQPRQVP